MPSNNGDWVVILSGVKDLGAALTGNVRLRSFTEPAFEEREPFRMTSYGGLSV